LDEIKVTSEDLLSVGRAAKELGISRVWAYQCIKDGKLHTIRLGGILFVPKSEVERVKSEKATASETP